MTDSTNDTETGTIMTELHRIHRFRDGLIVGLVAVCTVGLTFAALNMVADRPADAAPDGVPVIQTVWSDLPPCPTDETDQPDCYWAADTSGNGDGRSFAIIDGEVVWP